MSSYINWEISDNVQQNDDQLDSNPEFRQAPGTTPKFKLFWNKIVSGLTNDWKTAFKNLGGRLSGPAGLEIWNWSYTSCSLMTMPDSSQGAIINN